jgi:3-deoxy-7-phosphoheptulonate synthase
VRELLKTILQVAVVLTYSSGVPVVKIGRTAGQYVKPRSSPRETTQNGDEVLTYRGDMINRVHLSEEARTPDSDNIMRAYHHAASTLNLLRGFIQGGFADLSAVHGWNRAFVASSNEGRRYEALAGRIDAALRFMKACNIDSPSMHQTDLFTSHEALFLPYEEALTRQDSTANDAWYDCSAHMLWIGTRTNDIKSAHVEFLSGIGNPIGLKVGRGMEPQQLLALCDRLNPNREPGRLTLVSRMGRDHVETRLPPLIKVVAQADHPVVWMCDPMHGNTITSEGGLKTRRFDVILDELSQYFDAHRRCGTWPGGIHLELTGDNVTECIGGSDQVRDDDLHLHYETACDPRLNARQSLDLAFGAAEFLESLHGSELPLAGPVFGPLEVVDNVSAPLRVVHPGEDR